MKLIVGNFKMNLLYDDIVDYLDKLKKYRFANVVFCPSTLYLKSFIDNNLTVGCQDLSSHEIGSYTGDVSASQMASLGVQYAIIGHSERRKSYGDSLLIKDKLKMCLNNAIIPILCIGESIDEYENKNTLNVLVKQIDESFDGLINLDNVVIAYEPIWAIGAGLVPTNEIIENTIDYLKKYVFNRYGVNLKFLYGGSVSNKNINILENINNIDGYLVGGCSLNAAEFLDLINQVNNN